MSGRAALVPVALLALASTGMKLPIPHEYGRVTISNFTRKAKVPSVGFDHWRHRSMFTCRLCHVDVGFAMTANATKISAETNSKGYHCGACHDGKREFRGKTIFAACAPGAELDDECKRCHARLDEEKLLKDYAAFARSMPKDRFGGLDGEKAEAELRLRPEDDLEGVSIKRAPIKNEKEIQIPSRGAWMSDVLFSHPKHSVWNGCEVCHPDIYPITKAGVLKFTMFQITEGQSCGVCHDKVAFPLADCGKCHTKPVR